eukprot:54041-Eustigmatos_ZCMA.PRE.1
MQSGYSTKRTYTYHTASHHMPYTSGPSASDIILPVLSIEYAESNDCVVERRFSSHECEGLERSDEAAVRGS